MKIRRRNLTGFAIAVVLITGVLACGKDPEAGKNPESYPAIRSLFAGSIDPGALGNYEKQPVPDYILQDNTAGNPITNEGATLGRVLFYDKKLSSDNSISCASCHQQRFAFSDTAALSQGVNGLTNRHTMRLINARFGDEYHFFWDERASSLEEQTTMPIQDHLEMGFSGSNGDAGIDSLIRRLESLAYYQELFEMAFGSPEITEVKMQAALAQFVRSIQSFDSRYDEGRKRVDNDRQPFPNFTRDENAGKRLFMDLPALGGANCAICHRPPEFSILPTSLNNNVIGDPKDPSGTDLNVTRAPTLRDLTGPNGLNGPLMHDASMASLRDVIEHYNDVLAKTESENPNMDGHLRGPGGGQKLMLTETEKQQLVAFLMTLQGDEVYRNPLYSDPFGTTPGPSFRRRGGTTP